MVMLSELYRSGGGVVVSPAAVEVILCLDATKDRYKIINMTAIHRILDKMNDVSND